MGNPHFSRRHYRLFAEMVAGLSNLKERKAFAKRLADEFEKDNERFNRDLFLEACGVPSNKPAGRPVGGFALPGAVHA